jgi:hypothetical protein
MPRFERLAAPKHPIEHPQRRLACAEPFDLWHL